MTEQNQNENSYIYNAHQSVLYEMWKAIWLQKQSTLIFLVSTFFFSSLNQPRHSLYLYDFIQHTMTEYILLIPHDRVDWIECCARK